jgi:hypothetical protein
MTARHAPEHADRANAAARSTWPHGDRTGSTSCVTRIFIEITQRRHHRIVAERQRYSRFRLWIAPQRHQNGAPNGQTRLDDGVTDVTTRENTVELHLVASPNNVE